jgi:hypothetical protein
MAEDHRRTDHQIIQDNQNHKQLTVGIINSFFPKLSSFIVFITAKNPSRPNNPGSSAGNNPMNQLVSIIQGSYSYYHFFLKID